MTAYTVKLLFLLIKISEIINLTNGLVRPSGAPGLAMSHHLIDYTTFRWCPALLPLGYRINVDDEGTSEPLDQLLLVDPSSCGDQLFLREEINFFSGEQAQNRGGQTVHGMCKHNEHNGKMR